MDQYLPLKSKSNSLGDAYYKCVYEHLIERRSEDLKECLRLGRQYRTALRQQLKDLARLNDAAFIDRERSLIANYLQLIDRDIDKLRQGKSSGLSQRRPGNNH